MKLSYGHLLSSLLLAIPVSAIPYSEYILAPSSRTLYPASIHKVNGSVANAKSLLNSSKGSAIFAANSSITIDYLKNVAGLVSITVGTSSSSSAVLGLTYTESSVWINGYGSDSTANAGLDAPLTLPVGQGPGTYIVAREHERGGFRYLSIVNHGVESIEVKSVVVKFTAAPEQDLRSYKGYFHSNDELLNRIWYAGAYTNQLCNIDPTHGDALVHLGEITSDQNIALPETVTWYNNRTIANGTSIVTDGAKRDRQVWPGDMAIALPSIVVSTNDLVSVRNALDSLIALRDKATGMMPYAGFPFANFGIVSFTYHLYTLIGIANYYLYSGDLAHLTNNWGVFVDGLAWSLSFIDNTGLMNVTSAADWLRVGMGGHNIEANAILYEALNQGIKLANILNDKKSVALWTPVAARIKTAANTLLWNPSTGLYTDNETTTLSPQDGNAWAVKANLTLSSQQSSIISSALKARWGTYGAPAPEAGTPLTISPFIGGFELEAHLLAGHGQAALDLIRRQWGFMLNDPRMTNSTFIEGYSADGGLHYAPFRNDPMVNHAHGWSTGPTSLMTFYVAGIHLDTSMGKTWTISPVMGDLTSVDAGFVTGLGSFSSTVKSVNGQVSALSFETPECTTGTVLLPGVKGKLVSDNKGQKSVQLLNGAAKGLGGGKWKLVVAK